MSDGPGSPDAQEARALRLAAALTRRREPGFIPATRMILMSHQRLDEVRSGAEPRAGEDQGQQQQQQQQDGGEGAGIRGTGAGSTELNINATEFHSDSFPQETSLDAPPKGEGGGGDGSECGGAAGPPRRGGGGEGGGRGDGVGGKGGKGRSSGSKGRSLGEEKARIEYEGGRVYEGELSARGSKKHGQVNKIMDNFPPSLSLSLSLPLS
jgi:hypothetical protein